jgi:ligand-binding sensor domain-containing protein/signal transduction histidine kinase
MLLKWLHFGVFALYQLSCAAQSSYKTLVFNHFSEEKGLPQNSFNCVLQDKKGFMWFGTYNALIKYDGYSFTNFQFDPLDKNSFPDNEVISLCEDAKGNIWIAGPAGISKYDTHLEKFISYTDNKKTVLPAYGNCMITDKAGKLWIGTDEGLYFYDDTSDKFIGLRQIVDDTLPGNKITSLMCAHDGSLWIATNRGINIYDEVHKKLKLFHTADKDFGAVSNEVFGMFEDNFNSIWFSVWKKGICRYNLLTGNTKMYRHSAGIRSSLGSDIVNTVIQDSHQTIWLGTYGGGISIYQPSTDNFINYLANLNQVHSLNSNHILRLFQDRSGALWIATSGGGLNNCYPASNKFRVYKNYDKDYISHYPLSLYKDSKGEIFMTTFGAGVQQFDPLKETFRSYKINLPNNEMTRTDFSFDALEDSDGNFWVVTFDEGILTLDRKTGKFITIHPISDSATKVSHTPFNCIAEDPDKNLWIGAESGGLKCYNLKTKKYTELKKLYFDKHEEDLTGIEALHCSPNGTLWIGSKNGFGLFNTKTGTTRFFKHDEKDASSLSNNTVNCFYGNENIAPGKIWIGTNGGLNEFDSYNEKFRTYTMKDGLPDNSVMGIIADDDGRLWISTNKGICKFTPPPSKNEKAICRTYNINDGLPGDEFFYNTSVKGNDGTLYLGSNAGLVAFKPGDLKDNTFIPPVAITSFSVLNKYVVRNDSTGILKLPADEIREIKLSYRQNVFSVTFSALNYIHPEKNQYAYMLEPYDKDWIYTDATKRFANYTNLDADTYTFKVKASNNDGVWNEEPATIKIIITPPYWQTWWFRAAILGAIALSVYALYRYRVNQLLRLQNIRNKISGDLHDDIGSTLNSISVYSEVAKQDSSKHVHALEMIGEASRKIIDVMSDIVWTINPENDSFENIILRMRSLAFNLMRAKNIEFIFRADESLNSIKLSMENRRNLFLIFKEALNNLVKYSNASKVSIQLAQENSFIKLTIRDDGKGFDTSAQTNGNGLNSMKRRADEMKARLQIESVINEGTSVELILKS